MDGAARCHTHIHPTQLSHIAHTYTIFHTVLTHIPHTQNTTLTHLARTHTSLSHTHRILHNSHITAHTELSHHTTHPHTHHITHSSHIHHTAHHSFTHYTHSIQPQHTHTHRSVLNLKQRGSDHSIALWAPQALATPHPGLPLATLFPVLTWNPRVQGPASSTRPQLPRSPSAPWLGLCRLPRSTAWGHVLALRCISWEAAVSHCSGWSSQAASPIQVSPRMAPSPPLLSLKLVQLPADSHILRPHGHFLSMPFSCLPRDHPSIQSTPSGLSKGGI